MAVLVTSGTRVIGQGITGRAGTYHASRMMAYGTAIVAAVTPGKGGRRHLDMPVFNTVVDAIAATGATASIVFVPPAQAADAMIEAIEADLDVVVCVTERVPLLDMVRVKEALAGSKTRLIGPNSQGLLVPGVAQIGVMTTINARAGHIGIASRAASLTSEVVAQLSRLGIGQSATIGVGGDPIHGLSLADCVELFADDPGTHGLVLIGEIGGREEEDAAAAISRLGLQKPVAAYIAGRHAPTAQRMGHAGALVTATHGRVDQKADALRQAGVTIVEQVHAVGETLRSLMMGARA